MAAQESKVVRASIGYYQPKADGTAPDVDDLALVLGVKDIDRREVLINDIRGREEQFRLEEYGFQIVQHDSSVHTFSDDDVIKSAYYAEVEDLLLKSTGAKKIYIFNHIVRNGPSGLLDMAAFLSHPPGPAPRVHIDQTPKGATLLMRRLMSDSDISEIESGRWQIVNVWRPLKTIQKDPLAFADPRTVPDSDLIPLKRIYPGNKEGENCTVKADGVAQHQWYYLGHQHPSEVLLFKQHDSDPKSKTRGTPHTSFSYAGTEHLENRESIEVRAIVSY